MIPRNWCLGVHVAQPVRRRLACALALLLVGCGGGDIVATPTTPTTPTTPAVATTIEVTSPAATLTAIGATTQMTAVVRDRAGAVMPSATVTWQSSDSLVARVSATGAVTAVANGSVTITATAGNATGALSLRVAQAAARLSGPTGPITFTALRDSVVVAVLAQDANGVTIANAALQWSSTDERVATVNSAGVVRAVGAGSATVSATDGTQRWSAIATVAQQPARLVLVGANTRAVAVGDTLTLQAEVQDRNGFRIAGLSPTWSSSDIGIATVEGTARVRALRKGTVRLTASAPPATGTLEVTVDVADLRLETIPASLATPAAGATWEIPVVIVRYLPSRDGRRVDSTESVIRGSLDEMRQRIAVLEDRVKFMLEEGSRFRGYRDASALPSLGYRVLHIVTVYDYFPRGREVPWNPGHYFPDYHRILGLIDAQRWVEQRGVKEFWVWGYHSNTFEQPESNMSSPLTGDISNSSRFADDLPVFAKSYTVYGYNFARTQAEAVHNHGHQLEAILSHVDQGLFWREFVGRDANDKFIMGRAGWTHMPPNTLVDYDYLNTRVVPSDIADWRPGGGTLAPTSLPTWASIAYRWPTALAPGEPAIAQKDESQWYVYWMQNMPGRGNAIAHGTGQMTNWWQFTGDWDAAIGSGARLSTAASTITVRNEFTGDITLSPGGLLRPGATVTLNSSFPLTVSVWTCGNNGCRYAPFTLQPGGRYRVVHGGAAAAQELVIVTAP